MDFIKEEDFKNTKNRVLSERKFDIHMSFSYFNCLTQMALQPKNAEFANNKELYFSMVICLFVSKNKRNIFCQIHIFLLFGISRYVLIYPVSL